MRGVSDGRPEVAAAVLADVDVGVMEAVLCVPLDVTVDIV